jgi:ABC-2 type transport system ATP-binding protein
MVEVTSLTRYYGSFAALQDTTFAINEGEIVGLLGRNGAGKSTCLKMLAGLLTPSSGTIRIAGLDEESDHAALQSKIGYLPEDPPLYTDMRVTGFLRHIGRLKGMKAVQIERRIPKVLELTQLQDRANQLIETLSHGYRKRVGIAQAIIHDPKLVILDEPISGLDPAQIVGMRDVVRGLAAGRAVILSSHILGEISATCDRLVVIHDGKMVAVGTESELSSSLGASNRIKVTCRGDAAQLRTLLEASDHVASVEVHDLEGPFVKASVRLNGDLREALIADLVQGGFGLRLVETPMGELEEIFLGLTGRAAA